MEINTGENRDNQIHFLNAIDIANLYTVLETGYIIKFMSHLTLM